MHNCLQIEEILNNIFGSYNSNLNDRRTLLHLALVCKIFHEPALDALWRFQYSLLPLLKTLPKDSWVVTGHLASLQSLSFKRPLIASDWHRFQFYAKRMKKLSFRGAHKFRLTPRLHPSILHTIDRSLDLSRSRLPLLQNLRLLSYNGDNEFSIQDTSIFLGPRLTGLSLDLKPTFSIPEGLSFLTVVKSRCPSLEDLQISWVDLDTVSSAISDLVCDLPYLRRIVFPGIDLSRKALIHLASLPYLSYISVRILTGPFPQTSQAREDFPIVPFPSLKDCLLGSVANADEFLRLISSSNLESLSINTPPVPSTQELHALFTTLQQCHTLTTFNLYNLTAYDEDIPPSHSLEVHTLLPLLQCPNLEVVNIHLCLTQEVIDNTIMKDMALAWPRLRRFCFVYPGIKSRPISSVNLEGLLHLAQHCHALESVTYTFDVSLPVHIIQPGRGICNQSMTHLSVGRSPVTNPHAVAAFLSGIFPNARLSWNWGRLCDMTQGDLEPLEMRSRWREAHDLFAAFVTAKKQKNCGL